MKKLLLIGFVFLTMLSSVFAITNTTEDKAYWKFNETTTDLINSINLTQSGNPTYELGILDNSTFLDGVGDYWTTNGNPYEIDNNDVSISFWMNATDITPTNIEALIANRYDISGTDNKIAIRLNTDGTISINTKDTGAKNYLTNTSIISGWNHIVWTRNGANCKVYQNGILTSSITDCPSGLLSNNKNWVFGDIDSNDDFNGELDEIFITGYEMTQQNVTDLYNGGSPTTAQQWPFIAIITPILSFSNISLEGMINFNNTFWNQTTLNFTTNVLNSSTNGNVNQTSYLYNSTNDLISSSQFATNNLNGNLQLLNISEGLYKIYFYAENNETNVTSQNYTFSVDITPPTINDSLPTNISSYDLGNLSVYINCANINTGSCVINFTPDNMTFNVSQNVTFSTNGNQTYIIKATDGAGNIATKTGNLLVNPFQYFRFYDTLRALYVENYNFGVYNSLGEYVSIPVYDLGLGNQILLFSKFGYPETNHSFNLNLTSSLNQTFNITPITITVQVFDENSPSTQLNFNLSMNNVSNYTQYLNQLNFSKYYNETLHGNLTLTAESDGYSSRKIYTELNPYTATSHIIYLLTDGDSTPVIFRGLNLAQTQSIEDVVFTFKKEISGVPTFMGQAKTDSQGYTYFNMDVLGDYEITISKNGYVTQIINSIPGKSEYTILMEEEGSSTPFLYQDFTYSLFPIGSLINSVPFNVSAYTFDEANLISSMRFTVTGDNTSFTDVLTTSNGGTIQFTVTNISPQYLLNLTVMRNGEEYNFIKKLNYYQIISSNATVQKVAEELSGNTNNENRVFMMIILYVIAVVLGSLFSPTIGAVAGLLPITIFAIPTVGWLTPGVAALFYLLTILGVLYFER